MLPIQLAVSENSRSQKLAVLLVLTETERRPSLVLLEVGVALSLVVSLKQTI